jgi:hypothetical protein
MHLRLMSMKKMKLYYIYSNTCLHIYLTFIVKNITKNILLFFFYTLVYLTSIPLPYSHSNTPDIYMNKIHAYLHM